MNLTPGKGWRHPSATSSEPYTHTQTHADTHAEPDIQTHTPIDCETLLKLQFN